MVGRDRTDWFFHRQAVRRQAVVSTPLLALARLLRMRTLELRFSGDLELEALIRTRDKRMVRHKVPYRMSEGRNASGRTVHARKSAGLCKR